MAITIKQLNCRVTVKVGGKEGALHKNEGPPRPSMAFAVPKGGASQETGEAPSKTATEDEQRFLVAGKKGPDAKPKRADPQMVANRVYDLMREEIRLARLRGG